MWNSGTAENRYLINAFDIDLNDPSLNTAVSQIKPSLINAISKDIANDRRATAEVIDSQFKVDFISQAA